MAFFLTSRIWTSVLGSGVDARAYGAGGGSIWTGLVGVAEAVVVAAMGDGVGRVDWGDLAGAGEEANSGSNSRSFLFGDRDDDGGSCFLGSNGGVRL